MHGNRRPVATPRARRGATLAALIALGVLLPRIALAAAAAPSVEEAVDRLARQVIAPCCFVNTVAEHDSPASRRVRAEIRELVASGASDQEVLDTLVRRYGERILAMPRAGGFGALAWLVPPLALLTSALAITRFVRRARREHPDAVAGEPEPLPEVAPELRARLDAELAALEGGAPPFAVAERAR